jgi:bifunctional DNase/RNase
VFEAEAIAMVLQGVTAARPLPYDLLTSVIAELGAEIQRIVVTDLNQDVFYARIILLHNGLELTIDSRPSDAIALAVRAKVPILVDEGVMERAGIRLGDDEGEGDVERAGGDEFDDDRLSAFRDFISTLDLDDFGNKPKS